MFKFVKKSQVKLQCNEVQKLNAKFYLRVHCTLYRPKY